MESIFILIPIAIVIVAIAVATFFWAVKSGQFEDLDTEGKRILFDNDDNLNSKKAPKQEQEKQVQSDGEGKS